MKVRKAKGVLLAMSAVLTGVVVLAGCAAGSRNDSEDSGDSTPITVWVDLARKGALEESAKAFTSDTGIEVKLVTKDFGTVNQDFITQVPTGKGPDVIVGPADRIGAFVAAGVIAPVELGDTAELFPDVAVQAMTYDDKVYGVPYSIENVALIRNKALLPEPVDGSFDDVVAAGRAVGTTYPFLVGLDPVQGDPYHLYALQTSFGSQVFAQNADGSYDADQLVLGDDAGVAFAKALQNWGAEGILNPNIDGDKAREFFIGGQSPYYLTGPWNLPALADAGLDYAIDPIPSAGGETARPFIGVNGFFVSSKSKNALAANNFVVNYLTTEAAQMALYEAGGRPPALTSAYDKAAAENPDVAALGKIGMDGVPMPSIPQMGSVWADWGGAEIQIIKGEGDPTEIWTTAANNIQAKIAG